MPGLVGYLLLFLVVGIGFILVHLLAGKLLRPNRPGVEKGTIYECGEPTIGSAWIQFDLRFYVVALLFVIFDVEVAFFFPWAEVFGKANTIVADTPAKQFSQIKEISVRGRDLIPDDPRKANARELLRLLAEMSEEEYEQLQALVKDRKAHDEYVEQEEAKAKGAKDKATAAQIRDNITPLQQFL